MKGLPRSRSRGAPTRSPIVTQSIRVDKTVSITAVADAVDAGEAVLAGLPQGNILFLGAVSYLTFDRNGDTNIDATFEGDYGVGTVPNADVDLGDAGEANLIPSTAITAAVAGVTPVVRGASTDALGGLIIDNTDGSLEINLNVLIDDNEIADTETVVLLVKGVLHISYIVLGDD